MLRLFIIIFLLGLMAFSVPLQHPTNHSTPTYLWFVVIVLALYTTCFVLANNKPVKKPVISIENDKFFVAPGKEYEFVACLLSMFYICSRDKGDNSSYKYVNIFLQLLKGSRPCLFSPRHLPAKITLEYLDGYPLPIDICINEPGSITIDILSLIHI